MNRFTLNLLAGVIVLVSSWTLAVPQAARAQDPPSVACCTGGGDECCGDRCRSIGSSCEACIGFWNCLFF